MLCRKLRREREKIAIHWDLGSWDGGWKRSPSGADPSAEQGPGFLPKAFVHLYVFPASSDRVGPRLRLPMPSGFCSSRSTSGHQWRVVCATEMRWEGDVDGGPSSSFEIVRQSFFPSRPRFRSSVDCVVTQHLDPELKWCFDGNFRGCNQLLWQTNQVCPNGMGGNIFYGHFCDTDQSHWHVT